MSIPSKANPKALQIAYKLLQALKDRNISYHSIILFGSQARGTAELESDVDLLVIVDDLNKYVREVIVEEAFDLSLEENADVIAIPCDVKEFYSPLFQADAFYKNIQNDGVVILQQ